MDYKLTVAEAIHKQLEEKITLEEIYALLEKPKHEQHGDVAFPCFQLASIYRQNPASIAQTLELKVTSPLIDHTETVGPYLNFFLNKQKISTLILKDILKEKEEYGSQTVGNGQNIPIDMSSPNIAKPMSMGHLRSTVIGHSISKIVKKMGFHPVLINHLGDWGTQFGKLITAYKKWGNEKALKKEPITELLRLYVTFHNEAENDASLENEGRLWFKRLEDGDEEAYTLWKWFRDESLKEFEKIYERLHIDFDSTKGEAFYNDQMNTVVRKLEEEDLLVEDQGALVVNLDKYDLNPALIKKSDGATLYITRDLAAAIYRKKEYDFVHSLYVVGQEQSYHFKQLKAVLKEAGESWADDIYHIPFGMITKEGKKLSTRKGKVVLLEEVLDDAVERALQQIKEKNPSLENKEAVAEQVGVGAVVFHDLKNDRLNNFDFSLDEVVQFEGETGPYVQYTRARALSILSKASFDMDTKYKVEGISDDYSWQVIKILQEFPSTLQRAYENFEPSIIAKHALHLSQAFNRFYANVKVLEDHDEKQSRLALVYAVTTVLKIDLDLLGIETPEEM